MSIIDELITDRTQEQADRLEYLSSIRWDDMTRAQQYEWLHGGASELVYWLGPEVMRCLDGPIYVIDENGTNKGAYNWKDLNRVCEAMEYMYRRFTAAGYYLDYGRAAPAAGRTEWRIDDIPTPEQMARYIQNARSIRAALHTVETPELPPSMEDLSPDGANAIEQVMMDAEALLAESEKALIYSGVPWALSGAPGIYAVN